MVVPNTWLLEKWAVTDWHEWNCLPDSIQNSAVLFHNQKSYIAQEKVQTFKETASFHLASSHSNYLNQKYFHIFYIPALPAWH